ncbi:MAG: hypothetical protein IJR59_04710, partial [Firmicutes bacterium]|nr:hypothetical protein [Bacillota bacterium]
MKQKNKIFYTGKANDYFKIIIITITLLLVIFMNISLMSGMMSKQTEETGQIQLDRIKGDLEGTISEAERIVMRVAISSEPLVADNASRDKLRDYIIGQKNSQKDISNGNCTNIYIAGTGWEIIPDFDVPEDFHAQERIWYKGAAENYGEIFITEPYIDIVSGDMCFTMSTMLSDRETVVGADFNFSHLQESVSRMTEGTDRTALIATKQGMIVGYTDMSYVGQNIRQKLPEYKEIFDRVVNSREHSGFRVKLDGVTQTIFSAETTNHWYMMLCIDNTALYRDNYRQMILNTCVNLVMVLAIIFFYTVSVHNRIKSEKALAVKEEFLSGLSTELREPLKRILNKCDLMLSSQDSTHEDAAEIKASGLQLSEMLDNLFSFSSIVSDDKNESDAKAKSHIHLPRASRFTRNAVIFTLIATLITGQLIIIRTTVSWGDSKMQNETENYENRVSQWVIQQESVLSMFTNIISETPEIMNDYEGAVQWLDGVKKNYPEISVCYMANPYKKHTVIMNNGWEPDEDWKVEERPWYIDTEKSLKKFNISAPYLDEQTGNYCITMSKVVYGRNGEFLGIFGIDFFMDKLINVLGESYTKSGYAFLVDNEGIIINHPNPEYQMSSNSSVSIEDTEYNNAYHSDSALVIKDYTGEYVTCMANKNAMSDFTVIVVNRWWDIYANTVIFPLLLLILFGLCIAAVTPLINRLINWQQDANRKLARSAGMALAAGKAQAQFMAQMSHEIRTPINAVLGMNEMILNESSDKEILDHAENIRRAGKTLLDLINS